MPIEPPRSRWNLPAPHTADEHGLCAVGADLAPGTLLAAYRSGLFPMAVQRGVTGWWSPDPRGIIPLDGVRVSRTLRRSARRFEIRFDTAFREVMLGCADPSRPHGWITRQFIDAYTRLYELGWAHSAEVYLDDQLVGGLYGVRIGRLFAGESMFHLQPDASKVALVAVTDWLNATGASLFDVQWTTAHLCSMGAIDVSRSHYLQLLAAAVNAQTGAVLPVLGAGGHEAHRHRRQRRDLPQVPVA